MAFDVGIIFSALKFHIKIGLKQTNHYIDPEYLQLESLTVAIIFIFSFTVPTTS